MGQGGSSSRDGGAEGCDGAEGWERRPGGRAGRARCGAADTVAKLGWLSCRRGRGKRVRSRCERLVPGLSFRCLLLSDTKTRGGEGRLDRCLETWEWRFPWEAVGTGPRALRCKSHGVKGSPGAAQLCVPGGGVSGRHPLGTFLKSGAWGPMSAPAGFTREARAQWGRGGSVSREEDSGTSRF